MITIGNLKIENNLVPVEFVGGPRAGELDQVELMRLHGRLVDVGKMAKRPFIASRVIG